MDPVTKQQDALDLAFCRQVNRHGDSTVDLLSMYASRWPTHEQVEAGVRAAASRDVARGVRTVVGARRAAW